MLSGFATTEPMLMSINSGVPSAWPNVLARFRDPSYTVILPPMFFLGVTVSRAVLVFGDIGGFEECWPGIL